MMKNKTKACIDTELHKKHRCKCEKSPEFRKAYAAEKLMYSIAGSLCRMRLKQNLTPQKLAQLSGLTHREISMLEKGDPNATIKTLLKAAEGMGKKLVIKIR